MKKIVAVMSGLSVLALLSGCSTTSNVLPYQGKSAEYIYSKGHQQVKEGDYYDAIKSFRSLSAQYPFQKNTEMGNLELIYSYYQSSKPALAYGLSQQFIKAYPASKYIGYVYYMMGVLNYDNGGGLLQRRLPYTMSQHDPSAYVQSFRRFKEAIEVDPKGPFVQDAKRRMVKLNNTVAAYEYNIAQFYFNRAAYVGAINRAKIVVERYPQSTSVEGALELMVRSYNILNLPVLANKSAVVLKANYPNNSFIKSYVTTSKSK